VRKISIRFLCEATIYFQLDF